MLLLCRPTTDMTSCYSPLLGKTGKANKQRHQPRTRHINNSTQNTFHPGSKSRQSAMQVYVCHEESRSRSLTAQKPNRSEIREGTDEVNLTRVIKLTTDTWGEELGSNIGLG